MITRVLVVVVPAHCILIVILHDFYEITAL